MRVMLYMRRQLNLIVLIISLVAFQVLFTSCEISPRELMSDYADIGNEQSNAIGDGASMTWKVQANKSGWTGITDLKSISNNGRVLLATKNLVAKDLPVVCRLQAHNTFIPLPYV